MAGSVIQMALALLFATLLSFKTKGSKFFRGALYFPCLICGISVGFIFKFFFTHGFVLDTLLSWVGFNVDTLPYWLRDESINNIVLVACSLLWRYTDNPVIRRNPLPGVARIFNSAVVPFEEGFIGVFRGEQTNGIPFIYLGRSADGIHWTFDRDKIPFVNEKGEWFWSVDESGQPASRQPIVEPWKCPYHNGRMCMELIRRDPYVEV